MKKSQERARRLLSVFGLFTPRRRVLCGSNVHCDNLASYLDYKHAQEVLQSPFNTVRLISNWEECGRNSTALF